VTPAFDNLLQSLKTLPGLGMRSAERIALHLLVEKPTACTALLDALTAARAAVGGCPRCGNLSEGSALCAICADPRRQTHLLCIVEKVPDLIAMERAGAYRGCYHVLHGKLSPIHDVGPADLNLAALAARLAADHAEPVREVILALSNDIEGEATCHYIQETLLAGRGIQLSRIGFGLPSGSALTFADPHTLRSALSGRRALSTAPESGSLGHG